MYNIHELHFPVQMFLTDFFLSDTGSSTKHIQIILESMNTYKISTKMNLVFRTYHF